MISSNCVYVEGKLTSYLSPVISLFLLVVSLGLCFHSFFSRNFFAWIVPFILTLAIGVFSFFVFLPVISPEPPAIPFGFVGNTMALYIFDCLWFVMIVVFKFAFSLSRKNRKTKQSRDEYEYLKRRNRKEIHFDEY